MKYVVVAAKSVSVRIGTHEKSEIKVLKKDTEFETDEAFAANLVTQGFVKLAESKSSAKASEKTTKPAEGK
jgi:hypothetical protein